MEARFFKRAKKNATNILTSQDFSWLQNGQLNWVSKGSIALRRAGGFRLLFFFPILYHFLFLNTNLVWFFTSNKINE